MNLELVNELKGDFPLLIEAGFVAVNQNDEASALRLFHAAQVLEPMSTAPKIGFGFIALNKLELEEAEKHFQGVLKSDSEHHLAQAFLGITLAFNEKTRSKGRELLEDAMEKSDDPHVKNLGEVSLGWINKDFKKK